MKTVNFIFGVHNHQPVGNFDFVLEDAYRHCYLPFIEILEEYPAVHLTFHFSGCLLEWIENHHPEYLDRVRQLVARGNIEIISGGFFEPILSMIPERDKIGQIQLLNRYIGERLGYDAQGLWLTERVWEPHLAKPIAQAGIKYITVDDYHFLSNGKTEAELTGYFLTEEEGWMLGIFPINQKLRYAIPFKEPQATLDYLAQFASEDGENVIVMLDDGEKFGVWPGTYEQVFENNWLKNFFQILTQNAEWLKTWTLKEWFTHHKPKGRIYLPTASYFEMSEWALPPETGEKFGEIIHEFETKQRINELRPFLKGGIWRNFLYKYDESNWMQKKMLALSGRLERLLSLEQPPAKQKKLLAAREHLWRGTCNCAYWHGIFGGLYLPHLRHAIYSELLACQSLLREVEGKKGWQITETDLDCDGSTEILMENQQLFLALAPHHGGIMQELSLMKKGFNLLNTIRRYREAYHRKVALADQTDAENASGSIHDLVLSKEKGLEKYLKYDKYPRKNLVDHVIHPGVSLEKFRAGEYYEDSDFIFSPLEYQIDPSAPTIRFQRRGWINWQPCSLEKKISLRDTKIIVAYRLVNLGDHENVFRFGPEFNFALLGGNSPDRYYIADGKKLPQPELISAGICKGIQSLGVVNEWDQFQAVVVAPQAAEFWHFPVETVSLSEAGFERVYQSSVIIPWFDLHLAPQQAVQLEVELQISEL